MEHPSKKVGCYVCGAELIYSPEFQMHTCGICAEAFSSNMVCPQGHFMCDSCHTKASLGPILYLCRQSADTDPLKIATQIMKDPEINMHGPEHHVIVAASLLTAYKNAGGQVDFERGLSMIEQRGKTVPGGICGSWGTCGAAISAGIFLSVVTENTSLSKESWGLCNLLTSRCLDAIAIQNGPRCCKRDSYTAIIAAVDFVREHLSVSMSSGDVKCFFYPKNRQCKGTHCRFYPQHSTQKGDK